MLVDGTEYQTVNQLRRKPGIYSRIKKNGELESEFNLEKGFNFKMILDPVKQIFFLILNNRKHRLWTLLNLLEVPDSTVEKVWGIKLLEINKKGALNTEVSEMTSIYKKVYNKEPKDFNEVISGLKTYFNDFTRVDPETTALTLGAKFSAVTGKTLLATSAKLLAINKGKDTPDDRDSLIFKRLYSVEDLLLSHFEKQKPMISKKLERSIKLKDNVEEIISSSTFGKPVKTFFTTGDLSAAPAQTNPVTIVEAWRRTSPMGAGGIQSRHSVTMETRNVQPTHLGYLDPLVTPECFDKKTEIFTKDG
jgi:DNA-directed RNA polymerase beta subunit